ncbi:MAG: glycosyltransferase, partial [Candidatus Bipolaricaulia bacterium]
MDRRMSEPHSRRQDSAENLPRVSIVVPMRNEEKYIGACLAAIVAQDYAGHIEVLVVDGMSEDRSRSVVSRFAETYPFIRLLENPKYYAPSGLNIAIRHAPGDIIVRVDGHTILEPDYVRRCVETLQRTGAGNVGGLQRAISQSYLGRAIALTTHSPLAVGDSKYRYAQEEGEVDTVYLGA